MLYASNFRHDSILFLKMAHWQVTPFSQYTTISITSFGYGTNIL